MSNPLPTPYDTRPMREKAPIRHLVSTVIALVAVLLAAFSLVLHSEAEIVGQNRWKALCPLVGHYNGQKTIHMGHDEDGNYFHFEVVSWV